MQTVALSVNPAHLNGPLLMTIERRAGDQKEVTFTKNFIPTPRISSQFYLYKDNKILSHIYDICQDSQDLNKLKIL